MDCQALDPADDPRGARLENWSLLVTAAAMVIALGTAVLIRARPWVPADRALKPSPPHQRFVVRINWEDWPTIALLPGIGKVLAHRIVAHRASAGPFARVEDLTRVKGIGPKTVAALRPCVCLDGSPPTACSGP